MMKRPNLPSPHNNFFRFAMTDLAVARSLLETHLPRELVAEIKLDTLRLEPGSFVDESLRDKHSDLLFSVANAGPSAEAGEELLVYLLFEHKSQSDRLTILQLLSYEARILEATARSSRPLCPIIPLVIYHGERAWSAPKSMSELIPSSPNLSPFQIDFRFHLLDLSQTQDSELGSSDVLQSCLMLLKYGRSYQLKFQLLEIFSLLASLAVARRDEWLKATGVYAMAVNHEITFEMVNAVVEEVFPTQIEPGSIADQLIRQGLEKGLQEGLVQGIEQGREQGLEQGLEQGIEKGFLAGKIQVLQEVLGDEVTAIGELKHFSSDELERKLSDLQLRLKSSRS